MIRSKKRFAALLAAMMALSSLPAYAAELTEMPDYFGIQAEAQKVETGKTFTVSYGRYKGPNSPIRELYDSFTLLDTYHYTIPVGEEITVTNTRPASDKGFVYIFCEEAYPMDSFVDPNGETVIVPGGYFADVDENCYYLGKDGQWVHYNYGEWIIGQVTDADEGEGTQLNPGESATFTLPNANKNNTYLLYCYYYDPDNPGPTETYTEYQYNIYRYEDQIDTVSGFTDVHPDDYYAEAVQWAVENDVTNGTSATTFSPAATVTRAQAATFLWRAAGCPAPASTDSPFTDVADPDFYAYQAILWAVSQGITNGVSADRFAPDSTLAYDQMLALLCRAAGVDCSGADWSSAALNWAKENGLTDGLSLSAKGNCPRGDVVYFLWQQMDS